MLTADEEKLIKLYRDTTQFAGMLLHTLLELRPEDLDMTRGSLTFLRNGAIMDVKIEKFHAAVKKFGQLKIKYRHPHLWCGCWGAPFFIYYVKKRSAK